MKLENRIGDKIGKIEVIKRGPDYDGATDTRAQWLCMCLTCFKHFLVIARDLKRYKSKWDKGCRDCSGWQKVSTYKFKYGKNKNGFTDKSVKIPI